MSHLLNADTTGTPLTILEKANYDNWLAKQDDFSQNWLTKTGFSSQGLALLPKQNGDLAQAVFVVDDASHYFACGDLITQLPEGQYLLQADEAHHQAICFAWLIGAYQFDRYINKKAEKALPVLAVGKQALVDSASKYASATSLVRDLVNTPAADMMPEDLAHAAQDLVDEFGGEVKHIIGDDLLTQNYPTIHAVGRASVHAPRLIDLTWGDKKHPKVTLVGKGVCFDSGGLDVKPAAGMRNMKKDMGGSAHVLGLAQLIMAHKLPICLRVLIPAVENAVSGNALRPGDVVVTRKGISVEIDNTDAEGRLVMCDALAEAENDNPELLIDFATLTGAMRVALGTELPGFFSTSDDVANGITLAGSKITDPVWRMPLYKPYRDLLKSTVADMTNCATVPFGGAVTAALYLQDFINEGTDWVHFDVMAFNIRKQSGRPLGGEAFGIRAVFDYLNQRFG
ncbi:leucyl aminopeptidase family protein [Litorilituus sediminis]|uniref:Leucyl aminopeptidase family protein n=1 Tax=Litorilituus sediminis TaxID=718192 RepID=A0A4P6PA09_9GAMM|nr:leucyl aminopeptidase family protein [Litorilituus sediminis]QBG36387.1 leucyl aminopeptidase family protein [Litorilituus sediminis]